MIRDDIKAAQITAMKARRQGDARAAIRLIQAAIKNRDIELRTGKRSPPDDDVLVTEVLQKMIKQRRELIDMYAKGGRQELADAEAAEVAVIERFLPAQMSEDGSRGAAIERDRRPKTGASSVKDMGRVMALAEGAAIRAASSDMSKASAAVKARACRQLNYAADSERLPITAQCDGAATGIACGRTCSRERGCRSPQRAPQFEPALAAERMRG